MTLWFVFALMTAAAVFAVLLPLGLSTRAREGGSEAVVYRDQLEEIDRDAAAGLIGAVEAQAARVEIGRRLLAAAESEPGYAPPPNLRLRRFAAVMALAGLPLLAVAIYLPLGSPRLWPRYGICSPWKAKPSARARPSLAVSFLYAP